MALCGILHPEFRDWRPAMDTAFPENRFSGKPENRKSEISRIE
jgi:hypothetical protein